jgi:hypothetical protein
MKRRIPLQEDDAGWSAIMHLAHAAPLPILAETTAQRVDPVTCGQANRSARGHRKSGYSVTPPQP